MTPGAWYERAFRGEYLTVYAHRDEASARREAAFAARVLELSPGDRVLDLACGAGRHARALADAGFEVIGADLSPELLASAGRSGGGVRALVRADMRRLPFAGPFDAITMFFTSFGYFGDEENAQVLAEAARILRPAGALLLDGMNRDVVIAGLVPESERTAANGGRIREFRGLTQDGRRVEKRVEILPGPGPAAEYTESVRLYAPDEIEDLLDSAGFHVQARYGDLAGAAFGPDSPRLVIIGRRRP